MSSQDADPPRKTLSLKTVKRSATPASDDDGPRKRTGARARQVAQQVRVKEQSSTRREDDAPTKPAPRRGDAASAGAPTRAPREGGRPLRNMQRDGQRETRRDTRPAGGTGASPRPARVRDDAPVAASWDDILEDEDTHDARPAPRPAPRAHATIRARAGSERYTVFAPCPQGMEEALTIELQALGFEDAQADRAGARFTTDWTGVERANLYSRLATRVLVQVAHAPIQHEDDILELARATPWERWFGPEHTLRVDTSAIRSPMKSLQFCNLRAKDGICDRLRDLEGERPSIDTVRPDARVHLFLTAETATLYLDTSGESLFKRGWRLDKGEAPLRENLAAGLLALAGWDPAAPLLDPFCGSGTILIEAAWIALGVPPGISRPFGFERLRDHDSRAWDRLRQEARANVLPQLDAPLVGIDRDPAAIAAAQRNAERAWLSAETIRFEVGDARTALPPADSGWIVTNPPYGERLDMHAQETLWPEWAAQLKRHYAGWHLNVITSDLKFPQALRLKAHRRTPVHNGALDCRLFAFDLVEGSNRHKDGA